MISITISFLFIGCFALYNTSKKAFLSSDNKLQLWLQKNIKCSNIIGLALLIVSFFTAIFYLGVATGIVFWLLTLMTILSLLIVVAPTRIANYKHIIVLFTILLTTELIFYYAS